MEEFFTRDRANEGVKVPLHRPDGSKSDHWLLVRGVDSDEFRRAERECKKRFGVVEIEAKAIEDTEKRVAFKDQKQEEQENQLLSSLIADWSFDKPCTSENVAEFFLQAPQIADAVNKFAGHRALFFKEEKKISSPSQKRKSNSRSPRKAATKP